MHALLFQCMIDNAQVGPPLKETLLDGEMVVDVDPNTGIKARRCGSGVFFSCVCMCVNALHVLVCKCESVCMRVCKCVCLCYGYLHTCVYVYTCEHCTCVFLCL